MSDLATLRLYKLLSTEQQLYRLNQQLLRQLKQFQQLQQLLLLPLCVHSGKYNYRC
ncbi:hypothetical protein BDW02DRAFT_568899 [Decorospora gaudefroyi]|uniref:Uncharacterized protein n=1 Tax=Decorospora gaudefroyi TaxID=184978 RepID=A0A6A5KFF4_9PLEO|nr:hypothetical protein BDW02DRAFT_568899 [Decorospora gaudefroyi]